MTTRAVLARPRGASPTQFEGVYLHNAGMPSELGPTLWTLMRDRYNFDAAGFSREMIDNNLAGWSNIDCLGGPLAKTWDGKTKLSVEEHQENFNADREDQGPTSFQGDAAREMPGITAPPIDDTSDNWGADLVYVIGPDAMHIVVPQENGYELVGSLPWDEEPDWDSIDESIQEAFESMPSGTSDGDKVEVDETFYDYDALETTASLAAVSASFTRVQRGDIAGAQAVLLKYLERGTKTPKVLANLYYTLRTHAIAPAKVTALFDETIEQMQQDAELITPDLLGNMMVVLNNAGRGADSLRLFELAMEHKKWPNASCYVGMTFGAFTTHDPVLMQRAVEHVERAMIKKPAVLAQDPGLFDNTGALYLQLGNKAKALEYVKLCKEHNYVSFAAMPTMSDYAAIKDDPEFLALFT